MEELVDAFLYLDPPDLSLTEKIPADIVLDSAYMKERQRRLSLMQSVGAGPEKEDLNRDLEAEAQNPIYMAIPAPEPTQSEIQEAVQMCIEMKKQSKGPQ